MTPDFSLLKEVNEIRPREFRDEAEKAYLKDVQFYISEKNKFESRACPGCGLTNSTFFCIKSSFTFERCRSCLSIFMNPGPTSEILEQLYQTSENYKYWAKSIYPNTREKRHKLLHVPRAKWIKDNIDLHIFGDRDISLLEIGAGDGGTLCALHDVEPKIQLYSFEPNPDSSNLIDSDFISPITEHTFKAQSNRMRFSVITAFEVIEHLLNPTSMFMTARDKLKPGGLLMCSTPNALSLEIGALKENSTSLDIEHISVLTPISIFNLCKVNGFRLLSVETPGKFDVELISESPSRNIFSNMSSINRELLQDTIRNSQISSHMKFIAMRDD